MEKSIGVKIEHTGTVAPVAAGAVALRAHVAGAWLGPPEATLRGELHSSWRPFSDALPTRGRRGKGRVVHVGLERPGENESRAT